MKTVDATRKLVLVDLADVPVELRRQAAQPLIGEARKNGDLAEAIQLTLAAEAPTGRYWLPLDAVHTIL